MASPTKRVQSLKSRLAGKSGTTFRAGGGAKGFRDLMAAKSGVSAGSGGG